MFCCERLLGRQRQTVSVRIPQTRKSSFLNLVPWSPPSSFYLNENCNPILRHSRFFEIAVCSQQHGIHA